MAGSAARYDVHGLVLDLGDVLSTAERRRILARLRADVPAFAALVDAGTSGTPLGKGASDVQLPFADGRRVDIGRAWNAVHALRAHPLVADAEPAVGYRIDPPPTTTTFRRASGTGDADLPGSDPRDWSTRAVRADAARRDTGASGRGVRIGHPDTGYTDHPSILGPRLRTADGHDFVDDDPDAHDPMSGSFPGHGTATASVIFAGLTPELSGIAPGASLAPMRVSGSVIHFDFTRLIRALYRCRDRDCDLVSMSLGGPWAGRSLSRATDALVADGRILFGAAGNHTLMVIFPALLDSVIAVAGSNALDKPWSGSASGAAVDITAPGESVWRAWSHVRGGRTVFDTGRSSGTSYATATVAGLCALWLEHHGGGAALRQRYGGRLASVFRDLLQAHCRTPAGWNAQRYGPGIADGQALLAAALPAFGGVPLRSALRAPTRATADTEWARLQRHLPELTPAQVAAAVDALYAGPHATARATRASRTAAPPSLIDEIEFFVATDPAVRASFVAAGSAKRPARAGKRSATSPAGPEAILRRRGSAALRAALDD
ncbi:MAG: S8 family peptidase [Lysobacteraceae bacterium]